MVGPGKYDNECSILRELTGARAILIAVLDGHRGNGFSIQNSDGKASSLAKLPAALRSIADELERDLTALQARRNL